MSKKSKAYSASKIGLGSCDSRAAFYAGREAALREALDAAHQPDAVGQEPVAHRVMRKTLDGKWVCDERYWFDGPPSKELVESICADKNRWRVDVAYTTPQPARPPLTDAQLASACLSYRHDFGLLSKQEQESIIFQAREWERALWGKVLEIGGEA